MLETAYLSPERSQAEAAARLSPRTYRRHLTRALALLTAYLWEVENGPPSAVRVRWTATPGN